MQKIKKKLQLEILILLEIILGLHLSKFSSRDIILSSGVGINGREILKIAYRQNKLNYNKFFKIDEKFCRKNEEKILIGKHDNSKILMKKFRFKFRIYGSKLVKKMYKET